MAPHERVRRREFPAITRLTQIGRLLIALRIARGFTQLELAEWLRSSGPPASHGEPNEYLATTVEQAQRILDASGEAAAARVEEPDSRHQTSRLAGSQVLP